MVMPTSFIVEDLTKKKHVEILKYPQELWVKKMEIDKKRMQHSIFIVRQSNLMLSQESTKFIQRNSWLIKHLHQHWMWFSFHHRWLWGGSLVNCSLLASWWGLVSGVLQQVKTLIFFPVQDTPAVSLFQRCPQVMYQDR